MSDESSAWEDAVLWLRGQPDRQSMVRDGYFDDPITAAAARFAESPEWKATRDLLPAVGTALDLAAGRGVVAFALVKDGWTAVALEPDPGRVVGATAAFELSAAVDGRLRVVRGIGEQLPFSSGVFDLVICRQGLHHATDLRSFTAEASRVLRPGGTFIATREHVIDDEDSLNRFREQHPLHRLYGGENAYRLGEYAAAMKAAGLNVVRRLNPLESDLNLFPETRASVKARLAARVRWPWPAAIPDALLRIAGAFVRFPGRLYSFVAVKL